MGRKCASSHPSTQNVLIPALPGHKACFIAGRPCQLSVPFKGENCGWGAGGRGGGVRWRAGGNLVLNPLSCCFSRCCCAMALLTTAAPLLGDGRETGISAGRERRRGGTGRNSL